MKYVELIIFDLDGTLVDSKEAIAKTVNFALAEVGLKEKSASEIVSYIGTGVDDLISKSLVEQHQNLFERTKSVFENYRINSPEHSHLYPGVKEILEYFKHKKKVIVSNRKHEFALRTLQALNIYGYFKEVKGADDIISMKPSSYPLEMAMKRFNIEKEKTIIVGDMDVDILAGKGAGIATCAVTYGIGEREDIIKAGPDYIIEQILDLKNIIN